MSKHLPQVGQNASVSAMGRFTSHRLHTNSVEHERVVSFSSARPIAVLIGSHPFFLGLVGFRLYPSSWHKLSLRPRRVDPLTVRHRGDQQLLRDMRGKRTEHAREYSQRRNQRIAVLGAQRAALCDHPLLIVANPVE